MTQYCQLWLSCANQAEASSIASALLGIRLIACAKQMPISSTFWWNNQIEQSEEVMLLMESKISNFDQIEVEVAKLHSYDTFVLQAVGLAKLSTAAAQWMEEELSHE